MIPVQFVESVGSDCTADLGWEVMPMPPAVGDTVRLRSRPDGLAATVLGREWGYCELRPDLAGRLDRSHAWHVLVWVHTGDADQVDFG